MVMRSVVLLLLSVIVAAAASLPFFITTAAAADEQHVVALTAKTFDDAVGKDKAALVEFYAPWCGHCKKLAPEFEKLGEAFKANKDVLIAKVKKPPLSTLSGCCCQGYPVSHTHTKDSGFSKFVHFLLLFCVLVAVFLFHLCNYKGVMIQTQFQIPFI